MENEQEKDFEVIDKRVRREGPETDTASDIKREGEAGGGGQGSEVGGPTAVPRADGPDIGPPTSDLGGEGEAEHVLSAAEGSEPGEEVITPDVYSLVQWFIEILSSSAWQWMGLQMNPVTKKVEQDLAQARVAIDSIVFLSDQVAPHVSEEQRRAYRARISDLRVNFIQRSEV